MRHWWHTAARRCTDFVIMDVSSQTVQKSAEQPVQQRLSERSSQKSRYGSQLKVAALSLFIFYATLVVNALIPPSLLNPAWLMRLASVLIGNAFLPLLGLALISLAVIVEPSRKLENYSKSLARWAVLASLGFLLLLPLQAWSAWRLIRDDFSSLERGKPSPDEPLQAMETAIRQAPDAASIQTSLAILRGPAITPEDMARPLPELKQVLLNSLQQARTNLLKKQRNSPDPRSWVLIQDVLRFSVASLGFAAAFAAFAQRIGANSSLLSEVRDQIRFQQAVQRVSASKKRNRRRRSSSS